MNDLDEIMAKANGSGTTQNKKPFDKNAWIEKKQQERQEVYDLMDKMANEIKSKEMKVYVMVLDRFW